MKKSMKEMDQHDRETKRKGARGYAKRLQDQPL
jgi:hypothetical protein